MLEESVSTSSIWASMNSWFTSTVLFVLLNIMIATIFFCSTLANQQQQQDQAAQDDPRQPKLARSPSVLQRLKSINLYTFRSQEHHPSPPTITHFKQTLDSDTHYHHEQTLETQTHYLFEQTHQQEQQQTLDTQSHYLFEQTHQQEQQQTLETQTHYLFEQTHHPQTLETQTQYVFEQAHQPQQIREKDSHDDDEEEEEDGGDRQTLDEIFSQLTDSHVSRTKSDTKPASGEVPARLPAKMRKSASLKSAFGHFEENDVVEAEVRRPATVRERRAKVTEVDDEVDAKADDFINKFKQQLKLQRLDSIIRYKEMVTRGSGK